MEIWREMYPDNLELKLEHLGTKATFLDLEIEVVDGKFTFKLYDKRDSFNLYIVRMPPLGQQYTSVYILQLSFQ